MKELCFNVNSASTPQLLNLILHDIGRINMKGRTSLILVFISVSDEMDNNSCRV